MRVMGIETSCDETAVAIVDDSKNIIANAVLSQVEHTTYGGVVPELASRSHVKHLPAIIIDVLRKANMYLKDLYGLSCTTGPGLIGGLAVGLTITKAISISAQLPFIGINHLEGHALTPNLMGIKFPYLLLLVSGGHTQIVLVKDIGNYTVYASTLDDAAGEAFDKVAKMLGETYPGGKKVEILAKNGVSDKHKFTTPTIKYNDKQYVYHMSFSGLKTAVLYTIKRMPSISFQDKCNIAASFQYTITCIFVNALNKVLNELYRNNTAVKVIVAAGGVAANNYIRSQLQKLCNNHRLQFYAPPQHLCTDNAAMIAWAGLQRFKMGEKHDLHFGIRTKWNLDQLSKPEKHHI